MFGPVPICTLTLCCSIPVERQKLRSGFPPRELHCPEDPTQPVALVNGEKVSVDILPAPAMPPSEEATRGEGAGQIKQGAGQAEGGEAGFQKQAQQTQQGNVRVLWWWLLVYSRHMSHAHTHHMSHAHTRHMSHAHTRHMSHAHTCSSECPTSADAG